MFGNNFRAEELAKNFQKELSNLKSYKKAEQVNSAQRKIASEVNPEDFLIVEEQDVSLPDDSISKAIDEVSSYAEDSCGKCGMAHDGECMSDDSKENDCGDMEKAVVIPLVSEDISYLMDSKAEYILFELGKIAKELRDSNDILASDMVTATAMDIKNDVLEKAAKKIKTLSVLEKMAKDSFKNGDRMTSDVIRVTIENIKKG